MPKLGEWLRDAERLLDIPITLILQGQAVRKELTKIKEIMNKRCKTLFKVAILLVKIRNVLTSRVVQVMLLNYGT
jgi:hypothetical protein